MRRVAVDLGVAALGLAQEEVRRGAHRALDFHKGVHGAFAQDEQVEARVVMRMGTISQPGKRAAASAGARLIPTRSTAAAVAGSGYLACCNDVEREIAGDRGTPPSERIRAYLVSSIGLTLVPRKCLPVMDPAPVGMFSKYPSAVLKPTGESNG
jgi:hypothetical protein